MDDVTNYVPLVHVEHKQDRVPEHVFHKLYLVGITRRMQSIVLGMKMVSIELSAEQWFFSTIKIVTDVIVTIFGSFITNYCISITI